MSSAVGKTCSSIVSRSCRGRSCKALSKKSRLRATAAVGHWLVGRTVCPADRSELRLEDDDGNRAREGVDDLCFEGIGLEAEAEAEEEGLATTGDEWEKRLRRRRNGSRFFARPTVPVILALGYSQESRSRFYCAVTSDHAKAGAAADWPPPG